MRDDEAIDDSVRTITLQIGQICNARVLPETWFFATAPEMKVKYLAEECAVMLRAMVRYAEQPCKPVMYPADWWQAVKQRFAPAWALKRWPVKLTIWEPFIIYPEIKLPREKSYVQIRKLEHLPPWSS